MSYIPQLLHPVNEPFRISQEFGQNPQLYTQFDLKGHSGRDYVIASNMPVYASLSGIIRLVRDHPQGYGLHIKITHEIGDETVYAHLSKVSVKEGDFVYTGQLIAYSGNSGFSSGPHLHLGYRPYDYDDDNGYHGYIDPKPYLKLTKDEYMEQLTKLEKRVTELENRLGYNKVRQDVKGSVWLHPEIAKSNPAHLTLSLNARYGGNALLSEVDAQNLVKQGWKKL